MNQSANHVNDKDNSTFYTHNHVFCFRSKKYSVTNTAATTDHKRTIGNIRR
jgi:hypothetical protein